jgi:multidrug efflux pump
MVPTSEGNPTEISDAVRELLPKLKESLPPGVNFNIVYDEANFIRASLSSIKSSIVEAALLVLLIIFLFLRNLRATLIPLMTIPVSLIGTLVFLKIAGFSINTISLLAMVLAVGLVVDDAIVVLENIYHYIEKGLSPFEAAKKGSREIAFSIVAMTLTLASVYAPMAFMRNTVGQLFIEFAVTLAAAVLVSGFVALTLSPMMCSRVLRAQQRESLPFIGRWLDALTRNYGRALETVLRFPRAMFACVLVIVALGVTLFYFTPSQLSPREDRGFAFAQVFPLPGKTATALLPYAEKAESLFRMNENIAHLLVVGDGMGGMYIIAPFKDWSERNQHSTEIAAFMSQQLATVPAIDGFAMSIDTGLPGIANTSSGGKIEVIVRTTGSYQELSRVLDVLQKSCAKETVLHNVRHTLHMDNPGLRAVVDHNKMALLEVSPQELASTLETGFDKSAALEFLKDGVRYAITITSDSFPNDLSEIFVKNVRAQLIPISSFVDFEAVAMPPQLQHTKQLRSATFSGEFESSKSMTEFTQYLEKKMNETLPSHFSYEWTGAAKMQHESSVMMILLFVMSLIFIYCVMAIQFESFSDPFIILLSVPLAACGALFFMWLFSQSLNIFTQIGLITLIGLITKHGILIVDFANKKLASGLPVFQAIVQAASQRLRPVLMTTGAMVFGSIPLMLASGAGCEARIAIGTVLVGGLVFGTLFTLFMVPAFYLYMKSRSRTPLATTATFLVLALCAPSSFAQQLPTMVLEETQTQALYTLEDAVARALSKNETFQQAKQQVELQKGVAKQTLSTILPKLHGRGSLVHATDWFTPNNGLLVEGPDAGLHLDMPLIDVSGIYASINGYRRVSIQDATMERAKQTLVRDVTRAYLQAAFTQRNLEIAEAQLSNAQQKLGSFQRQFAIGHVDSLALQRENMLAKRGEAKVIEAKTNHQTALGFLGYLIVERTTFRLAPAPAIRVEENQSAEILLPAAREQREDLKAQHLASEAAQADHTVQWLTFLPTLKAKGELSGPHVDQIGNNNILRGRFSLHFELPLFDGLSHYGFLQQTQAQSRIEKLKLSLLERRLLLEIEGALTTLKQKKKLLDAYEAIFTMSQKVFESAEKLFASGRTTSLDFTTAQSDLYQAESDVLAKRLDADLARVELAYALGQN